MLFDGFSKHLKLHSLVFLCQRLYEVEEALHEAWAGDGAAAGARAREATGGAWQTFEVLKTLLKDVLKASERPLKGL